MTYAPLTAALLLGLLLAASPAASQKLGLRESCRQDVATIYLAAHTNMEQTANELTLLKQQLNMLLPKHEAAERAFNKARDEADAALALLVGDLDEVHRGISHAVAFV